MGKSSMSKLNDADELNRMAAKLTKSDPESSHELKELARAKRRQAIRQMKRRPKKRHEKVLIG